MEDYISTNTDFEEDGEFIEISVKKAVLHFIERDFLNNPEYDVPRWERSEEDN
ncbi:MAG: hypothetical protein ACI86H_001698 [bacterium]|jgi:hypothetical protein